MSFTTWVRAEDEFGQFDVRKGDVLRDGVSLVDGYPEHVAQIARDGKPKVDLRADTSDYRELQATAKELGIPANQSAEELAQAIAEAQSTTSSDAQSSGTGEASTATVGAPDTESE